VLVEGHTLPEPQIVEAFFQSVEAEFELLVQKKNNSGERWVGNERGELLGGKD
jgi:hypothetical protein